MNKRHTRRTTHISFCVPHAAIINVHVPLAVCLMLYARWPRIGSMTETGKIKLPRSLVRLTTLPDNICEFLLERLHTFCINHGLRQIIIYIHHCENESEKKNTFVCDF